MVGQGSPKTSHHCDSAPHARSRFVVLCATSLLLLFHEASLNAEEFRLRLSWGGEARQWYGTVRISEGTIEDPQPLGVEPDEPGSMWLDQGHLIVRQRSPRSYDAVELLVRAPRDAKLAVQLTALGDRPSESWIEAPLEEVLENKFDANLDNRGNRIRIERQPGDLLPVHLDSPSMVFAPGDTCTFRMDTTRLPVASSEKIRFAAELKNPYVKKAVWQKEIKPVWESDQTVTLDEASMLRWEIPLDVQEGIYQLTITATRPGWLSLPQAVDTPLTGSSSLASRMLELVVLDSRPPNIPVGTLSDLKSVKVVEEIDPTHPEWWKRFANLHQLPRLRRLWNGPLRNDRSEVVEHSLGAVVRLQPNGDSGEKSWEAYTIPIKEPGKPHILEVRYPGDRPQTFGVSVVEPNELGAARSANLDTGVDQFEEVASGGDDAEWRLHRVLFWPKTKTPIVLITNRREDDPAFYGAIRVLKIADHLPRAYPAGEPAPARMLAAYLDRPLFPESFSAEEVFVSPSPLGMDDWRTFYQGGTRLVEYLNHVGYTGLFMSVYSDGSTIYPSQLLEPTTRYDTGAYLGTAQDPVRKDVLEMLFRLFDREGLKLVSALEFATPLPELEAILRKGGPDTQGMVWIGRDGRSWRHSYGGRAPYYNVLHARVQEAMLAVVRELVERYGHHPSFGGVAIQLSADGYAQLPASSDYSVWGLDDDTVRRFQEATGVQLSASGAGRFQERFQQLTTSSSVESSWLDWRAEQLAAFYRRVHEELTAQRQDARLYLAGARMFEGEAMRQLLRPTLSRRLTLGQAMVQVGVDPRRFSDPEGPVLLHGETLLPWTSLASQSVPLELESMRNAEDLAADYGATGTLFYHQPQETTLPSFDRVSPFQPSETRLTTQAVPSAAQNRRRLVKAMAQFDPVIAVDGSLRMPLGQEESLRDLITLYRRLPAARFDTVKRDDVSEPLTVRYLRQADSMVVVVINEAGFPVNARVRLRMPAGCRLEELTEVRETLPIQADGEDVYWNIQLDAYDAIGARLSSPNASISKATARWSAETDRSLESRVAGLVERRIALSYPRVWEALENGGFEADVLEAGLIPGWMFLRETGENVEVDRAQYRSGNASLRLVCTDQSISVMSLPFKAPKTGRVAVSLWIKSAKPVARLRLQIGFHNGRNFSQAIPVMGQFGDDWRLVDLPVLELPGEGLNDLQLRIQLTGPGEIWIDDIQLRDLAFDAEDLLTLIKTVYPARATLDDGNVIQCVRILESYWPRFLFEHVSPIEQARPDVARRPQPPAAPPAERPPERKESKGFLGRIRDLVPERLRF
jgi:glycosyl hydrolase family 10